MTPNLCIAVSAPTLRALLDFQSEHSSEIDLADLADLVIRDWLHHQRELAQSAGQPTGQPRHCRLQQWRRRGLAQHRPRNAPLPAGVVHAPQLRPDCQERRKVYRRAEDLLLD